MRWTTEAAKAVAADLCPLELDLQVAGLGVGAVPVLDFLGLKILKTPLWAPVRLYPGHTGPAHLLSPAGRNGLGYAPQGPVVWDDW